MYKILHIPTGTYLLDRASDQIQPALFDTFAKAKRHIKSHKYCAIIQSKPGYYIYANYYARDVDGRKMLVRFKFEPIEVDDV